MKNIIAIAGFTVALIGAGEYCRAEQIDHGCVNQIPQSVPLSALDKVQPIMAMDDASLDHVQVISGILHIGRTEGVNTKPGNSGLPNSRNPRDCLKQFQCPIDREPDSHS